MKNIILCLSINFLLSMPLIAAEKTALRSQPADSKCIILCDDKSVEQCAQSCRKQFMKQTILMKLGMGNPDQTEDSYKKCAIGCMTKHCLKVDWRLSFADVKS